MPVLKNPKHERFCQEIAKGTSHAKAWITAGYQTNANAASVSATRMLKQPSIANRVNELLERKAEIDIKATERAIEKTGITKAAVLEELAKIGFANMLDYIKPQADGYAYVDLSKLTREQAAAIQEVVVEEYKEGRGEDARDVKRVKFKLADKKGALVDIGKHLGMFIDRQEVGKPGDFSNMTDEEIVTELERLADAEIENLHSGNGTVN